MMESRLKATKNHRKFLEVYYEGSILDANHAIEKAIAERGIDRNKTTIICYPKSMKNQNRFMGERRKDGTRIR